MLRDWESGDEATYNLWHSMRERALEWQQETYKRLWVNIDKTYYESDIYKYGKELAQKFLEKWIFEKDKKWNIVNNTWKDTSKFLILRHDWTSVYATQDLALAKIRYDERKMEEMIYVVWSEQEFYFKQIFSTLDDIWFDFVRWCYHLSYWYISIPEWKMKSREWTVVDADNLMDEIHEKARELLISRSNNESNQNIATKAERIAIGAITFHFLKYTSTKDIVFDKNSSISFEWQTGPYVQYTFARCKSLLEKVVALPKRQDKIAIDIDVKDLVLHMYNVPNIYQEALEQKDISIVVNYLYVLAQYFNARYHSTKILVDDNATKNNNLILVITVSNIMQQCMDIIWIPRIIKM